PVSNFIERMAVPKVANISRRNGVYSINVAANLEPGVPTDQKIAQLQAWDTAQTWPSSVTVAYGGREGQIGETNAFISQAFGAAMFLIVLILLLGYNSFYQVIVTLTTVIMSLAGVLLGMLVTGMSFSAFMT